MSINCIHVVVLLLIGQPEGAKGKPPHRKHKLSCQTNPLVKMILSPGTQRSILAVHSLFIDAGFVMKSVNVNVNMCVCNQTERSSPSHLKTCHCFIS